MNQATTQPTESFFARLRTCIVASGVLLIAATMLHLPPWVSMIGGGAPLVYYHLGYLAPRAKKGLSQTAIDSVYYFGFLVTIAALGVSAVSLAVSGGKMPLDSIAFQFGLGLLATGYAVLARMHLTSVSTWVDEATPEAVLDRYVQRSRELVTNVELASTQFVELSKNLMLKSQEVAETARLSTEKSMLEVARMFDEELHGTLASARAGLTEIRGLVSETAFAEEREALVRGVKQTVNTVATLNKTLEHFAQRSEEAARQSQEVKTSSAALNDTLTLFHTNLTAIAGNDGPMLATAKSLSEAQAVVAGSTHAMGGALEELREMAGTVSGIGITFKNIKTLTNKANEQLEALANSSERLDGATRHIARSAEASTALANGLDRTSAALPALQQRAEALDEKLAGLGQTVNAVEQGLQGLPRPAGEVLNLSLELKEALKSVADVLATITADAKALAGHSTQHAQSLEHANRVTTDVGALRTTTESVQGLLVSLSSTVERLNTSLNASAGSLKSAVDTAAASLESDVKRSADTARLFAERLTDVAQIIIDRTRDSRPS